MLAEHKGITSTALAKLANAAPDQVLALLRELEAAGRARRTGQRRGTRWHAITDEDRIAARVAELERLSAGPGSATRQRGGAAQAAEPAQSGPDPYDFVRSTPLRRPRRRNCSIRTSASSSWSRELA